MWFTFGWRCRISVVSFFKPFGKPSLLASKSVHARWNCVSPEDSDCQLSSMMRLVMLMFSFDKVSSA